MFQRAAVLFAGLAVGVMFSDHSPWLYLAIGLVVCAYLVLVDVEDELDGPDDPGHSGNTDSKEEGS